MNGLAILDERARFVWLSREHADLKGQVVGKPLWHFARDEDRPTLHDAICRAAFEDVVAEYSATGGPPHDLREYDCAIRRIEAGFLLSFRGRPQVRLTSREREVLLAAVADEPPKATARRLGVSVKTVESFRGILRRKTGMTGTAGLTCWAIGAGLIEA